MARIRTIKPEFPQSETVGKLSRDARLLFIQLWTIVDDAGRTRAASRMLASLLYPYDDDAKGLIDGWLQELERHKLIRRYEIDSSQYLEVTNWLEHQKIDKPSASRLPAFVEGSSNHREDSRSVETDLGPRTSTKDLDQDIRAGAEAPPPRVRVERFEEFKRAYPKRKGANPWKPAFEAYQRHVRAGVAEQTLIDGAKRLANESRSDGSFGSPYVPQAVTWLRQQRWGDADTAPTVAMQAKVFVAEDDPAWPELQAIKKTPVIDGRDASGRLCRGWYFDKPLPARQQSAA